jgi:hypothetical protein
LFVWAAVGLIGSVHRLVFGSRLPCKTILPLYTTLQVCWSNITWPLGSQNCRVAINDACKRPGTMCAAVM